MTLLAPESRAARRAIPLPRAGAITRRRTTRGRRRLRPAAAAALLAIGGPTALAAWAVVYAVVLSGVQEHRSQTELYASLRQSLSQATTPFGGAIKPGRPVALIDAPTGGVHREVVVEGTTSGDLKAGPGHLADSAMPGQAGVSVLMGRSVTYGAPFAGITRMRSGDAITVTTGQGTFHYRVATTRLPGDPLPPLLGANQSRLTLATSVGDGWRAHWAPSRVVYVDATLVGSVQPTPSGRPTAVVTAALPMHSDPAALVVLVLWLQALILLAGAAVWARLRWGGWQTWVVGLAVAVGVLWQASAAAMRLLPNLT